MQPLNFYTRIPPLHAHSPLFYTRIPPCSTRAFPLVLPGLSLLSAAASPQLPPGSPLSRSLSRRRQGAVSRGLQDCPPSGGGLPLEGTRLLDVLCFTGDRARGRDPCLCPHAPPMHAPLRARIPLYIFMNESINTSKKLGEQLSYLLASPRMDKTHPLTQAHAMHACHAFTGCWRPMLRRRRRRRCGARPRPPGSCPGAPWHPPG